MTSLGIHDPHIAGTNIANNHSTNNYNGYAATHANLGPLQNIGPSRLATNHQAFAAMHGHPYANWKTPRTGGSLSQLAERNVQVMQSNFIFSSHTKTLDTIHTYPYHFQLSSRAIEVLN